MPPQRKNTHPVTLDCGHEQPWFPPCPVAGEVITCINCGKGALVLKGWPIALRLRCDTCRYVVAVPGTDERDHRTKTFAEMKAFKHASKNAGHTMSLYDHMLLLSSYPVHRSPEDDVPF